MIQPTLYDRPVAILELTAAPRHSESRTLNVLNRVGRALADPTRARILVTLLDGAAYPAELAAILGLTRSNVSNHLTCLRGCGLIIGTAEGRQVRYEIADPHLSNAIGALVDAVVTVDDGSGCSSDTCTVDGCCGQRS